MPRPMTRDEFEPTTTLSVYRKERDLLVEEIQPYSDISAAERMEILLEQYQRYKKLSEELEIKNAYLDSQISALKLSSCPTCSGDLVCHKCGHAGVVCESKCGFKIEKRVAALPPEL